MTAALSVCGFGGDRFEFGLAPGAPRSVGSSERSGPLPDYDRSFETPHRLRVPGYLRTVSGDDQSLVLCRELTKLHERSRGTLAMIARFAVTSHVVRSIVLPAALGGSGVRPGGGDPLRSGVPAETRVARVRRVSGRADRARA